MRETHLSDEAVAAFADDVLTGHARERARRHCAECAECNYAVAVQREAVWALRAAPAPSLPSGLLDRLRDVPATTPIRHVPTHVDDDGTAMFATFASSAAFVAPQRERREPRRPRRGGRPMALTVASLAALGALATTASADGGPEHSGGGHPGTADAHLTSVTRPAATP